MCIFIVWGVTFVGPTVYVVVLSPAEAQLVRRKKPGLYGEDEQEDGRFGRCTRIQSDLARQKT